MSNNDLIFADVETTGLLQPMGNDLKFQPWTYEIFIYRTTEKLKPLDEFYALIKIPVSIPSFCSRLTGIYDQDLAGKPFFKTYAKPVMKILEKAKTFVAHNQTFDEGMLDIELKREGYHFDFPPEKICTVEQSLYIMGYRLKQLELHQILTGKTIIKNQHRAKADVLALVENYDVLMIKGFKPKG